MPMIPYPSTVRALRQINRHQVERRNHSSDKVVVSPLWVALADELSRVRIPSLKGFPGQRRPSDG